MLLAIVLKNICFMQFIYINISLSTNFAESMISAVLSNRIFPYLVEVLVNAMSLQNYGDS